MKNYLLACLFSLLAFQAQAQEKKDSLLLIDSSFAKLVGLPYRTEYDQALAVLPDGGGEANIFMSPGQVIQLSQNIRVITVSRMPGMTYSGAGLVGGVIGYAIIDAKIHSDRQEEIEPIRDVLNNKLLLENAELYLREAFSGNGYPVKKSLVMHDINRTTIDAALKKSEASHAFVIRKSFAPIIGISSDNKKPILAVNIEHYENVHGNFRKTYEMTTVFIGHAATPGISSNAYWSENKGQRFLAEVKTGLERIVGHALETGPGMPSEKEMYEKAKLSRKNRSLTIEMLNSDADFAYGLIESSYYLIVPVQKRAEVPVISQLSLFDAIPGMMLSPRPEASVAPDAPTTGTAKLSVVGVNDSEDDAMLRRVTIKAYQNDDCNRKSLLKLGDQSMGFKNENKVMSDIYALKAGSSVRLNIGYSDVQVSQHRMCEASVSFVPQANHDYQLEFIINRDVTRCDARVVEATTNGARFLADFSVPPLMCGSE